MPRNYSERLEGFEMREGRKLLVIVSYWSRVRLSRTLSSQSLIFYSIISMSLENLRHKKSSTSLCKDSISQRIWLILQSSTFGGQNSFLFFRLAKITSAKAKPFFFIVFLRNLSTLYSLTSMLLLSILCQKSAILASTSWRAGEGEGENSMLRFVFLRLWLLMLKFFCIIHNISFCMGAEEAVMREREENLEELDGRLREALIDRRLKLSHCANVWKLCRRLRQTYGEYEIAEVHLEHNMIGAEVVEELTAIDFERGRIPLRALLLGHNEIMCESLKSFRGAYFGTLLVLHLDHNRIASDGCFYLSKTNLPKLSTLDLESNEINDNGAGHLSNASLPNLINFIINNNQLTGIGLSSLSKAHWPSLAFFQARENRFTPDKEMETMKFRSEVNLFRLELR